MRRDDDSPTIGLDPRTKGDAVMAKSDPTSDPKIASASVPDALRRLRAGTGDDDPTEEADEATRAHHLERLQGAVADAVDVHSPEGDEAGDPSGGLLSQPLSGFGDRYQHGDPFDLGPQPPTDQQDSGPAYGKGMIAQGQAQQAGSGYTFGTSADGEVAGFFTGLMDAYRERREYTTNEREADIAIAQIRGNPGGGGGTTEAGTPTNPVLHEYDNADGTHTTVYESGDILTTHPDGTVEHSYKNPDGSTTYVTERPDGSTTTTTVKPDGSSTTTTTTKNPDGTTSTTTTTSPAPPPAGEQEGEAEGEGEGEGEGQGQGEGDGASQGGEQPPAAGAGNGESGGEQPPKTGDSPGDPDESDLPEFFKDQIARDLAGLRAQGPRFGPGDGATDPSPEGEVYAAGIGSGPDSYAVKLGWLGQPGGEAPGFGGRGGDPTTVLGDRGGGYTDPAPGTEAAMSGPGPEERTGHGLPGFEASAPGTAPDPGGAAEAPHGSSFFGTVEGLQAPVDLPGPAFALEDPGAAESSVHDPTAGLEAPPGLPGPAFPVDDLDV